MRRTAYVVGRRMIILAALLLICASSASAQVTGTVTGVVQDASGGRLPGATVVLTSETKGTKLPDAITSAGGDFTFVNVPNDTYTIQVSMSGFKTTKRTGVAVSAGDRLALTTLTLEIGGMDVTVNVTADAQMIQTESGERSFNVSRSAVENLPVASRGFTALAALAPGVITAGGTTGATRIGGGGANNIQIDGTNGVDSGNNGILVQVNTESIAEVKVATSSYQAEFGRSSGLQITAVTKSGSNRFHGAVYDVDRNSDWNSNSKTNKLNGDPKTVSKQRDWGYSIGGPVGRPGGRNKLFFFYAQEFEPRTQGQDVQRFRVPTALERVGDYSQSTDNLGNVFRTIKNPNSTATCTATSTGGCFADGGVLGRIPANQLYAPGLAVLNIFPEANCPGPQCPGDWTPTSAFNLEFTRPKESLTSIQPAIRFDYQPTASLRGTFRWTGWNQSPKEVILGTIPGWNDSRQVIWLAYQMSASVNYSINSTTFLEASYGRGSDEEAGCALGTSGGAIFCRSGLAVNPVANINSAGLGNLPMLFPDAGVLDKSYYAYRGLTAVNDQMGGNLPIFDATTGKLVVTPSFTWGSRVNSSFAPPNVGFPGFFLDLGIDDYSVSLTKVKNIHTIKGGFYLQKSNKQQQTGAWRPTYNFGNSTTNPLDTGFGFANAAVGSYTQVSQASRYVEGDWLYYQAEGYIQDNWKVNSRLTLDYGVRLVHQQPQYDRHLQSGNFLPDKWSKGAAPQLYTATCANGTFPCTGTNRQAFNPVTGKAVGPNTTVLIGTIVQGTGDSLNGIGVPGKDIVATSYKWPMLVAAPRAGAAYDLLGNQSLVVRGGFGLFFDRPSGNTVFGSAANPPSVQNVAISNGRLQDGLSGSGPLATVAAPALTVTDYDGPIQSSVQWNVGMQTLLPMAIALDVSYVGVHNYNVDTNVNINSVDFGTMFLPQNQDPTVAATLLGSNVLPTDNLRAFRGFAAINQHQYHGWSTNHSFQIAFNRRFRNGFSFGFNDSIVLGNSASTAPRLQHAADGSASVRADQADANKLLGRVVTNRQLLKANFVWALPKLQGDGALRRSIGAVVNDWQLSGIWTGTTGSAYNAGFTYQNGAGNANLTGSPDYGARIILLGDPGNGCSSDRYRQFNTDAFSGPAAGSVGLESGADYVRGCFSSVLDLAIARNISLGHGRNLQLRVDMFNAPNQAGITGRNTTLILASPANPVTNQAPVFDPTTGLLNDGTNLLSNGAKSTDRATPKNAGFGVANGYQTPRNVQFQARFSF